MVMFAKRSGNGLFQGRGDATKRHVFSSIRMPDGKVVVTINPDSIRRANEAVAKISSFRPAPGDARDGTKSD